VLRTDDSVFREIIFSAGIVTSVIHSSLIFTDISIMPDYNYKSTCPIFAFVIYLEGINVN